MLVCLLLIFTFIEWSSSVYLVFGPVRLLDLKGLADNDTEAIKTCANLAGKMDAGALDLKCPNEASLSDESYDLRPLQTFTDDMSDGVRSDDARPFTFGDEASQTSVRLLGPVDATKRIKSTYPRTLVTKRSRQIDYKKRNNYYGDIFRNGNANQRRTSFDPILHDDSSFREEDYEDAIQNFSKRRSRHKPINATITNIGDRYESNIQSKRLEEANNFPDRDFVSFANATTVCVETKYERNLQNSIYDDKLGNLNFPLTYDVMRPRSQSERLKVDYKPVPNDFNSTLNNLDAYTPKQFYNQDPYSVMRDASAPYKQEQFDYNYNNYRAPLGKYQEDTNLSSAVNHQWISPFRKDSQKPDYSSNDRSESNPHSAKSLSRAKMIDNMQKIDRALLNFPPKMDYHDLLKHSMIRRQQVDGIHDSDLLDSSGGKQSYSDNRLGKRTSDIDNTDLQSEENIRRCVSDRHQERKL